MIYYNSLNKAIDALLLIADLEVGYIEKASNYKLDNKVANAGNKNYTKYGRDMHNIYPEIMDFPAAWCDCFVDWCFYKAFEIANAKKVLCGNFNDYTVASAQLYKNKKAWYSSPKRGDQIFFKNSTRIYHTALVYKADSTYVYTIEGNTANGTNVEANGGMVCKKKYLLSNPNIAGYGRPLYDLVVRTEVKPVPQTFNIKTGQLGLTISVDSTLNIRDYPKTGNVIGTLKNGECVYPDKKTFVMGDVWYHLPDNDGWFSAKYIDGGWVYETSISSPYKWWYIHKNYTCTTSDIEVISGKIYKFDHEGYMIENTTGTYTINGDGEVSFD